MSNLGLEIRRFFSTWKEIIKKKIRETEWIKMEGAAFRDNKNLASHDRRGKGLII